MKLSGEVVDELRQLHRGSRVIIDATINITIIVINAYNILLSTRDLKIVVVGFSKIMISE